MELKNFVVLNTIWYFVNSYNYTLDSWNFQRINQKDEEYKRTQEIKTERLLVGNILEYYIIFYLLNNNIAIKHDKNNPFNPDNGVDIFLIKEKINLFLKWTSSNLLWQIRKPLLNDYKRMGWYLLLAKISKTLIKKFKDILKIYFDNWGVYSTNKKIISIEEIKNKIWNININITDNIEVKGILNINDYEKNSIFVAYQEQFPWTQYVQNFKEWSYVLKKWVNFKKIKDLLKK